MEDMVIYIYMDGVINPYFVLKGTCQSTKENAVKPNVYSLYTQKQKENMLWGGVLPTHPSNTIRLTSIVYSLSSIYI